MIVVLCVCVSYAEPRRQGATTAHTTSTRVATTIQSLWMLASASGAFLVVTDKFPIGSACGGSESGGGVFPA